MERKKYKGLLALTVASMLVCLLIPSYRAMYYVRHADEMDDTAWYTEAITSTSNHNDDAFVVYIITLPSMLVIYATFIHYLLLPLLRPEEHQRNILPIFHFKNKFLRAIGKGISCICLYTIPVLLPVGTYFAYGLTLTSYMLIYIFPTMLAVGAFVFFNFYILYFICKLILHFKRKKGLPENNGEEWIVY